MIRVSYINNLGLTGSNQVPTFVEARNWLHDQVVGRGGRLAPLTMGRPVSAVLFDTTTQHTTSIVITRDKQNRVKLVEFGAERLNEVTAVLEDIDQFWHDNSKPLHPGAMIHEAEESTQSIIGVLVAKLVRGL